MALDPIELEIQLNIEKSLKGLSELKGDFSNIDAVTKKVGDDMALAFKKPSKELQTLLNVVKPVAGSLSDMNERLAQLGEKIAKVKVGTKEFEHLKQEIIKTKNELAVATGKVDEFGFRIKKGGAAAFQSITHVGEALVGVFNIGALAGFGEKVGKESEAAERAIKGLVVIESIRSIGAGVLAAKEVALLAIEKARSVATIIQTALTRTAATVQALFTGQITLAAVATTAFTAAIQFLTGPVGIFLAVMGAVILALEAFSDETKKDTETMIENTKATLDNVKARNDLLNKIDDLKNKILVEQGLLSEQNAEKASTIKEFYRDQEEAELEHNLKLLELRKDVDMDSHEEAEKYHRAVTALNEQFYTESQLKFKLYKETLVLLDAKAAREAREDAEKQAKKREAQAKKDAEKLLKLRKELAEALKELEKQSNKSIAENVSGEERLRLEAELANKELDIFKEELITKGRLVDKNFKLSADQEKQFSIIRLGIQQKYLNDLNDLYLNNQEIRNQLILDTLEKELATFDIAFAIRAKKMRAIGIAEEKIEAERLKGRRTIITKFNADEIDLTTQILLDLEDARERAGEREITFEKEKELRKLDIILKAAEIKLRLLEANPEGNEAQIAALKKTITQAKKSIEDLKNQSEPFSLAELLGLKLSKQDEEDFNQGVKDLVGSLQSIANAALEIRREQVLAEKKLNEELLNDLDKKVSETERALDRELTARAKGYANNVDGEKKALSKLKAERDKALEDKKKIQAEEKKLARQQAAIEAIQQVAALVTAGAKLFSKEVSRGGAVGVVLAIGAIAAMLASFLSLKSSVARATSAYGDGGWIDEGDSHANGGAPIIAERDEFVVRKSQAKKHGRILEAINEGNISKITAPDLAKLLHGTGVSFAEIEAVNNRGTAISMQSGSGSAYTRKLEQKIELLTEEVIGIRKELKYKPESVVEKNSKTTKVGTNITVVRK